MSPRYFRPDARYDTCTDCGGRKRSEAHRCGTCAGTGRPDRHHPDVLLADQYRVSLRWILQLGGAERLNRLEECFRDVLVRSMNPGNSKDLIRGGLKRRGWKACNEREGNR